ncbi:MAG: MAPEG family protein [Povalibacter sp.]
MPNNSPELAYSALAAGFTGILWIPIVLNRLREMGWWKALKNPEPDVRPHSEWAYRLASAHRNAVENLVVFAPLAISIHVLEIGNAATAMAAGVFFWARASHAVIYTLGVPLLRTVAFAIGFGCQAVLLLRVLGVP